MFQGGAWLISVRVMSRMVESRVKSAGHHRWVNIVDLACEISLRLSCALDYLNAGKQLDFAGKRGFSKPLGHTVWPANY